MNTAQSRTEFLSINLPHPIEGAKLQLRQEFGKSVIATFTPIRSDPCESYLVEASIPERTISPGLAPIEKHKFTVVDRNRADGSGLVVIKAELGRD